MSKKIYTTSNYDLFRHLIDNREVKTRTTQKIKESFSSVGYITNPIIVNEKMEVIDGQNRLEALRQLGMPVDYIIVEGAGIKECRALNINQSNWSTNDWINSYADGGNLNYMRIRNLLKEYSEFSLQTIGFATNNGAVTGAGVVKNGDLVCSEEDYANAHKLLDAIRPYKSRINQCEGRIGLLECALCFALQFDGVDTKRLLTKFEKYYGSIQPITNIEMALDEIERIYNYNSPKVSRCFIATEYKKADGGKANRRRLYQKAYAQRSLNTSGR